MNFTSLIARFATGTYTVTREVRGVDANGYEEVTDSDEFDILASVQQLTGRELQALTEGERKPETRKLYTATAVQAGDFVSIDGEDWEVGNVQDQSPLGAYYKAIISKAGD